MDSPLPNNCFILKLSFQDKNKFKLKTNETNLNKENEEIKSEQNLKELEIEKIAQYWTLTKQQLLDKQHCCIELEAKLQRIKTVHVEQVSVSSCLK